MYKVIPDEQALIETTLKSLVCGCLTPCRCFKDLKPEQSLCSTFLLYRRDCSQRRTSQPEACGAIKYFMHRVV